MLAYARHPSLTLRHVTLGPGHLLSTPGSFMNALEVSLVKPVLRARVVGSCRPSQYAAYTPSVRTWLLRPVCIASATPDPTPIMRSAATATVLLLCLLATGAEAQADLGSGSTVVRTMFSLWKVRFRHRAVFALGRCLLSASVASVASPWSQITYAAQCASELQ